MKKWMAILAVAAFASISQGQVQYAWHYDGVVDGTALNGAGNTGSTGTLSSVKWNAKSTAVVSNEMQRWEWDGVLASSFVTKNLSGDAGGKFELSYDIPTADFANTAAIDGSMNFVYGLRGKTSGTNAEKAAYDVGMRLRYEGGLNVTNIVLGVTNTFANADQFQIQVRSADLGNWLTLTNLTGNSLADLNLRTVVDLDADTIDAYFTLGGGSEVLLHSGTIHSDWALLQIRQAIQHTNGGNSWQIGDVVTCDNIIVSQLAAVELPETAVIDLWNYDSNTNGASLSEGISTGYVGGVSFNDGDIASISNNMVLFQHTSLTNSQDSLFRTASPSGGFSGQSTGVYELAWDYVAADFALTDAANSNANIGITVRDTANGNVSMGFRVQYNGTANEFRLQLDDANGNNQTLATFAGNTLSNLNVRLFMDLDNSGVTNSASLFYTPNGGVEIAATYEGKVHPNFELSEYRMVVQTINGGTGWQIGDTAWMDNLKFEKIAAMPVAPPYSDIVVYEMNDTVGTLLNALAQTGSDSGQFEGTDAFIATDGIGDLVFNPVTTNVTRKHFMGTTFTEGLNRLEFAIPAWDLDATTDGSVVKFALVDDTGTNQVNFGIDVNTNNATVRFRAAANNGGGAGQGLYDYGYVSSTGVILRIDVNLDGGFYNASWRYDNLTDNDFSAVVTGGSLGQLVNIAELRLAVTDTGWDAADFVNVDYVKFSSTSSEVPWSPTSRWNQWLDLYPGLGASTNETDDFDGDLYNNLYEYALGGDPTVANTAHVPAFGDTAVDGGTNYILYVYAKLKDNVSANRGLSYFLETNPNLMFGTWTNDNYEVIGTGSLDAEFNAVTNRVSTDAADAQFIRLQIELTP
jgi:hypothetical protein